MRFRAHEVSRVVTLPETESGMVVARGWGGRDRTWCQMGTESRFCEKTSVPEWRAAGVARLRGCAWRLWAVRLKMSKVVNSVLCAYYCNKVFQRKGAPKQCAPPGLGEPLALASAVSPGEWSCSNCGCGGVRSPRVPAPGAGGCPELPACEGSTASGLRLPLPPHRVARALRCTHSGPVPFSGALSSPSEFIEHLQWLETPVPKELLALSQVRRRPERVDSSQN